MSQNLPGPLWNAVLHWPVEAHSEQPDMVGCLSRRCMSASLMEIDVGGGRSREFLYGLSRDI